MYSFKKLKQNSDFRRIYGRGITYVTPAFVAYAFKNRRHSGMRIGITAGKKLGGAVQRNRAKRVITAAFASVSDKIKSGYDIVFVARTRILTLKSTEASAMMLKIFEEAEILNQDA